LEGESTIEQAKEEPKQDQLDMNWFASIQRSLVIMHLRRYDGIYVMDTRKGPQYVMDEHEMVRRLLDFYKTAMSIGWQAGWRHGRQSAYEQLHPGLESHLNSNYLSQAEQEALSLEQQG